MSDQWGEADPYSLMVSDYQVNQRAALYRAIYAKEAEAVFSTARVEDFQEGLYRDAASIIQRAASGTDDRDKAFSEAMGEALRASKRPVHDLLLNLVTEGGNSYFGSGEWYARNVAEYAAKERMMIAAAQFRNAIPAQAGDDLWVIRDRMIDILNGITPPGGGVEVDDYYDLDYFLSLEEEDVPFVFPGMLRKGERWLMVGKEGGGKSALTYQMLTAAAYGVDSLHPDYPRYEPQSVVFVDVENSPHQIAYNVKNVARTLQEMAPGVTPRWKNLKRRIIDLTDPSSASAVIRSVVKHSPDVLYMGTAYKLAFNPDYRVMARAIMSTIDRIRAEVECAVIVEHHAGHGDKNDRNGWRPDGSSEWTRWADFARGMDVRMTPKGTRVMKLLESSRMDRSTGREWPVGLRQGQLFPWVAMYEQQEFDHYYGALFPAVDAKQPSNR